MRRLVRLPTEARLGWCAVRLPPSSALASLSRVCLFGSLKVVGSGFFFATLFLCTFFLGFALAILFFCFGGVFLTMLVVLFSLGDFWASSKPFSFLTTRLCAMGSTFLGVGLGALTTGFGGVCTAGLGGGVGLGVGFGGGGVNCERFRLIFVSFLEEEGGRRLISSKERKKSAKISRWSRNDSKNPLSVRLSLTF